jgi:hypothetical protein
VSLSSRIASVVAIVLVTVAAREGHAARMTFSSLSSTDLVYSEDGITATGVPHQGEGFLGFPGSLHLDDGGTSFAISVIFTMASRFTPVGFDVLALNYHYCPAGIDPPCTTPYENVLVQGFRDGVKVFEDSFSAGSSGSVSTYSFSAIAPLDSFSITALKPDFAALGGMCTDSPCGHFNVVGVELVPEPTGLELAVALGFWRLRRRTR